MGSFTIPLFFQTRNGTAIALRDDGQAYSNETNTAQSIPLIDQGAADREGIPEDRVQAFVNRQTLISPARPAAAPMTTPNQLKKKSPLVWLGVAVGVLALLWLGRKVLT